jgi:hypothetical protein
MRVKSLLRSPGWGRIPPYTKRQVLEDFANILGILLEIVYARFDRIRRAEE